jgi:hypothetical protein
MGELDAILITSSYRSSIVNERTIRVGFSWDHLTRVRGDERPWTGRDMRMIHVWSARSWA